MDKDELSEMSSGVLFDCSEDWEQRALVERLQGMEVLERDVNGLNEIFKDVQTMVNSQGEKIDSIDEMIGNVDRNLEESKDHLNQSLSLVNVGRKTAIVATGLASLSCLAVASYAYFFRNKRL